MAQSQPQLVSADDLEQLLARLRQSSLDPARGLFGPDSISWKVNRESALFLAATRAALLQVAHPWVATAIAQHSKTFHDPVARFHQTFRIMFTMSFGSLEQAFVASRQLHRRHQGIRGTLPEPMGRFAAGASYEANEVEALLWVYATLIDSSVLAYELVLPPLSAAEREQYYTEGRLAAALFGVPPECWPQDWTGFSSYMNLALQSDMLAVTDATREMGHRLQEGAGLKLRPPYWYRSLTIQVLPPRVRAEFGFPYGTREQESAARALRWIRRIHPYLPAAARFVGPYNEALSRLAGKRPGTVVRMANKLWIGRPELFASPSCTSASRITARTSQQNLTQ
jgi:uncharacterized protein (DUF2236 family)